ncbi:MAG TPA: DUF1588 domain-containing protein [Polyangiaceae bacterium]|nr:DUF1588 domain-containing protein [Polyangiaceae bacterium]
MPRRALPFRGSGFPSRNKQTLLLASGVCLFLACGTPSGERASSRDTGAGFAGASTASSAASAGSSTTANGGTTASAGMPAGLGGAGGASAGSSSGGSAAGVNEGSLIPTRIRRLASAELDASVQALLGTTQALAEGPDFPPDLRQDGFTVNAKQRVDAVIVERLADAADALAVEAEGNGTLARLAPCDAAADPATCARSFVTSFGAKAYRRPLVDDEVNALLTLYGVGAAESDGTHAAYLDGITHVTRGLLQSAGFLYVTELSATKPASSGPVTLTQNELAVALSYLLTSAPPDDALLARADAGTLSESSVREAEARRLFANEPRAKDTLVRLVREWLGIDAIDENAKDTLVYPDFLTQKPLIVAESRDFVRAVAFDSTGLVSELLGAKWTVNTGPLALYQPGGSGPIPGSTLLSDRVGILNQAAFLATYANAHESHPVFRGVAIARRIACLALDSPASFNLQVVPPAPDPQKTTRERFDAHVSDPICAGCHDTIDPFGFAFELYDGIGAHRTEENGQPVDSSVVVAVVEADFDGPYADSNQLAAVMAKSPTVRECFARQMFRAAAATGDGAASPGEQDFIDYWHSLPEAAQGNMVETLIAYVKSPLFTFREGY